MPLDLYLKLGSAAKIFDSGILLGRSAPRVTGIDLQIYSTRQPLSQRSTDNMPVQCGLRSNCSRKTAVIDRRDQSGPGTFGKARLITSGWFLNSLKASVVSS